MIVLRWIIALFFNSRESRLRSFWRLLIHLILVIFLGAFATFLALLLDTAGWTFPSDDEIFLGHLQGMILILATFAAYFLLDRRRVRLAICEGWWWKELCLGLLLGGLSMSLIFFVERSLGWVRITSWGPREGLSATELAWGLMKWLGMFAVAATAEEVVSRGYHLKNLAEGLRFLGTRTAVLLAVCLSSMFFGLLHAFNPNATWIGVLGTVAAGIALAIGRITTGSLAAPIGAHIAWNFFQGPLFGFEVSGTTTRGSLCLVVQKGPELWTGGDFGPEAGLLGFLAVIGIAVVFLAAVGWRPLPQQIARLVRRVAVRQ